MNIKKLFPEKKTTKKGIVEFLDKKGFYIVLIVCLAIVGATAAFVIKNNINLSKANFDAQKLIPDEIDQAASKSGSDSSISSALNNTDKANLPIKEGKDARSGVSDAVKKNFVENKSISDTNKNQKFVVPLVGDVCVEYAQDKLVYSKTLEEWRTHSGVDLAADRGAPVKAVADGVVSEIKSDPRLGKIIILDHGNGIKSVYANLASNEMVSPNQKIAQGEVIGSVGNTANFESGERPHLHFEVLKNNQPIDPTSYLPK